MLDRYWNTNDRISIRTDDHLGACLAVRHCPAQGADPYLWSVTINGGKVDGRIAILGPVTASGRSWTVHRAKLAATRAYLALTGQERKLGRPRKTA